MAHSPSPCYDIWVQKFGLNKTIIVWGCLALMALPLCDEVYAKKDSDRSHGRYRPVPIKHREKQLFKTVNAYEDMFERLLLRHRDPELEALVGDIGCRLAPAPTDEYINYRFFLFRDPSPNAFALPDGQIYINTGMLAMLENEAQLAGLLGHEVNHTAGHHTIITFRYIRRRIMSSIILGPLTLGLSDIFLIRSIYGYSRDLETEADKLGFWRMLDGGYDVREMPKFFELMYRDPEGLRPKHYVKWSTHPALLDRAEYLREKVKVLGEDYDFNSLTVNEASYQEKVYDIKLLTAKDWIAADYPRTALLLLDEFIQKYPDEAKAFFLRGEAWLNLGHRTRMFSEDELLEEAREDRRKLRGKLTREEQYGHWKEKDPGNKRLHGNMREAVEAYECALEFDPSLAAAQRGLGYARYWLGEYREAGKAFLRYLGDDSESFDRRMILENLKLINEKLSKKPETEPAVEDDGQGETQDKSRKKRKAKKGGKS